MKMNIPLMTDGINAYITEMNVVTADYKALIAKA